MLEGYGQTENSAAATLTWLKDTSAGRFIKLLVRELFKPTSKVSDITSVVIRFSVDNTRTDGSKCIAMLLFFFFHQTKTHKCGRARGLKVRSCPNDA